MSHKYRNCIFAALFLLAGIAETLEMPAPPRDWVNDYASVLSPAGKQELNERLKRFEAETSNQIVVAIFPSLEEESLEDYVNRLYEAWRIGQKQNNNGVLLAVFVNDRKVRIEVGYGLEGALTDAVSSRIIREEIAPEFRNGNYDAGIRRAIDAIEKATRGEYKAPEDTAQKISPLLVFLLIVIGFLILRYIIRHRFNPGVFIPDPRYRGRRRNPYDDWWIGGSGGGLGGGGFGGGSGGGFSGGGGLSGGGGASGSW
jgi:uncharacterized protein